MRIKKNKISNKIKCSGQYTVDLMNNNISRFVQEECANRLYRVFTYQLSLSLAQYTTLDRYPEDYHCQPSQSLEVE